MSDRSNSSSNPIENPIPTDQVGDGNRAITKLLMGRLSDVGRQIVVDFLSGRPYREPSTIRADIEAQRLLDSH